MNRFFFSFKKRKYFKKFNHPLLSYRRDQENGGGGGHSASKEENKKERIALTQSYRHYSETSEKNWVQTHQLLSTEVENLWFAIFWSEHHAVTDRNPKVQ